MRSSILVVVLVVAVLVVAMATLVVRVLRLDSHMRSLESEILNLKEEMNSTKEETGAIKGLLPDDSWRPAIGDLALLGEPLFTARPYQIPDRPAEWRWSINCHCEARNSYREDLIVLFEIEFVCDPEVCVGAYQPYAKREYGDSGGKGSAWREGWTRLWDFDEVPKSNVLLVPGGGQTAVDSLGAELVTPLRYYGDEEEELKQGEKVFPEAKYVIRGTALLVHDNLHYTFTWTLAEGVLNQTEVTILES